MRRVKYRQYRRPVCSRARRPPVYSTPRIGDINRTSSRRHCFYTLSRAWRKAN